MIALLLAQTIAITGGTVYPVSGPKVANATVLIRDGKIVAVGAGVTTPSGAARIDATGKWVTPGLIDGAGQLGLVEIGAVPGTREGFLHGDTIAAAFNVAEGLNPASMLIPVTRIEGVTTALATPLGNLVAGQAVLIDLAGNTIEEMLVKSPVGIVADLSESGKNEAGGSRAGVGPAAARLPRRAALRASPGGLQSGANAAAPGVAAGPEGAAADAPRAGGVDRERQPAERHRDGAAAGARVQAEAGARGRAGGVADRRGARPRGRAGPGRAARQHPVVRRARRAVRKRRAPRQGGRENRPAGDRHAQLPQSPPGGRERGGVRHELGAGVARGHALPGGDLRRGRSLRLTRGRQGRQCRGMVGRPVRVHDRRRARADPRERNFLEEPPDGAVGAVPEIAAELLGR